MRNFVKLLNQCTIYQLLAQAAVDVGFNPEEYYEDAVTVSTKPQTKELLTEIYEASEQLREVVDLVHFRKLNINEFTLKRIDEEIKQGGYLANQINALEADNEELDTIVSFTKNIIADMYDNYLKISAFFNKMTEVEEVFEVINEGFPKGKKDVYISEEGMLPTGQLPEDQQTEEQIDVDTDALPNPKKEYEQNYSAKLKEQRKDNREMFPATNYTPKVTDEEIAEYEKNDSENTPKGKDTVSSLIWSEAFKYATRMGERLNITDEKELSKFANAYYKRNISRAIYQEKIAKDRQLLWEKATEYGINEVPKFFTPKNINSEEARNLAFNLAKKYYDEVIKGAPWTKEELDLWKESIRFGIGKVLGMKMLVKGELPSKNPYVLNYARAYYKEHGGRTYGFREKERTDNIIRELRNPKLIRQLNVAKTKRYRDKNKPTRNYSEEKFTTQDVIQAIRNGKITVEEAIKIRSGKLSLEEALKDK